MILAGMDVARINFSHGEEEDHRARIEALRKAAAECGREVGLMGDLQGPKIRVRRFKNSKATLVEGAKFFLGSTLGFWGTLRKAGRMTRGQMGQPTRTWGSHGRSKHDRKLV